MKKIKTISKCFVCGREMKNNISRHLRNHDLSAREHATKFFNEVELFRASQRFQAKVEKSDGCWIWQGARAGGSLKYGIIAFHRKTVNAHRLSWILAFGEIPKGMMVLHRCDVPLCVNPEHLFLGTAMDNIRDMIAKGRNALGAALKHPSQVGEGNHQAKLSEETVRRIKERGLLGATPSQIFTEFGIPKANAWAILRGKSWKHVSV